MLILLRLIHKMKFNVGTINISKILNIIDSSFGTIQKNETLNKFNINGITTINHHPIYRTD
jgi:hypothetical protein